MILLRIKKRRFEFWKFFSHKILNRNSVKPLLEQLNERMTEIPKLVVVVYMTAVFPYLSFISIRKSCKFLFMMVETPRKSETQIVKDHPFSTYAKSSEKHLLPPDTHTNVKNVRFLENIAYVRNGWSLTIKKLQAELKNVLLIKRMWIHLR